MSQEPIRIGLLGCGTVGQAVVRMIQERRGTIERASGHRLEVGPILVRDLAKPRPGVDPGKLTSDPAAVLEDPTVRMVIEVMGGLDPALAYLERAFAAGKSVVTANKQLLAHHGPELLRMAEQAGAELRFEASVGAAIPVIKALRESLLAAEIGAVTGIVNGTTNYMLTEMRRSGLSYAEALSQAQELGYAEADPTDDVGGGDAAAKLAIMSSIAFHTQVRFADVAHEGIDTLQAEDVEIAADLGFEIKLLAAARLDHGGVSAGVHPMLVPIGHPLASIGGPDNAVLLESPSAGEIMLVGPGAGGDATASAVLADVLSILGTHQGSFLHNALADSGLRIVPSRETVFASYVRLTVVDQPGVLARVASIFAGHGLSFRTVQQRGEGDEARLVMVLHRGPVGGVVDALAAVRSLDDVRGEPVMLRVIGSGAGGTA